MKFHFYYATLIAAFALESFAAYYSVFGLSALLGRTFAIVGGAITIEFGKIVLVSYMYNWRKETPKILKSFLWLIVSFAMLVTSLGIFGYLTNSFQQKQGKVFDVNSVKTSFNIQNIDLIKSEIVLLKEQIDSAKNRLKILNDSRTTQEKRLSDSIVTLNYRFINNLRTDIVKADSDIEKTNNEISNLISKIQQKNIELGKIQQNNFEIENTNTEVDVGPLKFIADIFKRKMKDIVSFIIGILMFLFDPFAISLFIITNLQIMKLKKPEQKPTIEKRKYVKRKEETDLEKIFGRK
jgi:hypothetical protein